MKKREMMAWVLAAISVGAILAWQRPAAPSTENTAGSERHFAQTAAPINPALQAQLDRIEATLKALGEKVDAVQSTSGGGRFAFYTGSNYIARVDRLKGDIAFYNDTGGTKWHVLSIPETPINESNSNFQRYMTAMKTMREL